jgi:hypothetical protein
VLLGVITTAKQNRLPAGGHLILLSFSCLNSSRMLCNFWAKFGGATLSELQDKRTVRQEGQRLVVSVFLVVAISVGNATWEYPNKQPGAFFLFVLHGAPVLTPVGSRRLRGPDEV